MTLGSWRRCGDQWNVENHSVLYLSSALPLEWSISWISYHSISLPINLSIPSQHLAVWLIRWVTPVICNCHLLTRVLFFRIERLRWSSSIGDLENPSVVLTLRRLGKSRRRLYVHSASNQPYRIRLSSHHVSSISNESATDTGNEIFREMNGKKFNQRWWLLITGLSSPSLWQRFFGGQKTVAVQRFLLKLMILNKFSAVVVSILCPIYWNSIRAGGSGNFLATRLFFPFSPLAVSLL